jgi:acyl-CoA synthetase (AMP-forming)/AMP-acid ligase II
MFWVGGLGLFLLPNWWGGAHSICTEATQTDSRTAMGSVLSQDDMEKMIQVKPYWGLGMSETFGPYSYGDIFRAPGRPVCAPLDNIADGYEMRVADDADQAVGDGEIGEIQVRGYPVATGLHKLTRSDYYTADGFYHTGDLGLREGKRVHFVGRDGDMIKTVGSNVSPAEVEMEMQQLEGVHSAYVVGIPDAQRGQLVVAAVVPRAGVELDFEAMQATLRQRLSSYKVPRAYISISREDVPMLPSNKVARREIARIMAERLSTAA